jgi:hypothetical protein
MLGVYLISGHAGCGMVAGPEQDVARRYP